MDQGYGFEAVNVKTSSQRGQENINKVYVTQDRYISNTLAPSKFCMFALFVHCIFHMYTGKIYLTYTWPPRKFNSPTLAGGHLFNALQLFPYLQSNTETRMHDLQCGQCKCHNMPVLHILLHQFSSSTSVVVEHHKTHPTQGVLNGSDSLYADCLVWGMTSTLHGHIPQVRSGER